MSKKVLIISGSPRKGGNSDLLCDEFMRGAAEEKGVIYGTGVYQPGEIKKSSVFTQAYEIGKTIK